MYPPVISKRVQLVSLSSLLGQRDIAPRDSMATSPHNSGFSDTERVALHVKDVDSVIWCRLSDCQGFTRAVKMHGIDNGSLRRSTAVVVGCVGGPKVSEPIDFIVSIIHFRNAMEVSPLRAGFTCRRSNSDVGVLPRIILSQDTWCANQDLSLWVMLVLSCWMLSLSYLTSLRHGSHFEPLRTRVPPLQRHPSISHAATTKSASAIRLGY